MTEYEIDILQKLYANVAVAIPNEIYIYLNSLGLVDQNGITITGKAVLKICMGYLQVDYSVLEFPETANIALVYRYQQLGLLDNHYLTPAGRLVLEGE